MSGVDDAYDVTALVGTATTLVRPRLEIRTHCKAFLMTEEILSYTHPFRTPRCRGSAFCSRGYAEAKDLARTRKRGPEGEGGIINDRDGVSLALNSSWFARGNTSADKGGATGYPRWDRTTTYIYV